MHVLRGLIGLAILVLIMWAISRQRKSIDWKLCVAGTLLQIVIAFAVLYYAGVLQRVVFVFAWLMQRTMRLSGAESLAAAANIFVGQTEAPW